MRQAGLQNRARQRDEVDGHCHGNLAGVGTAARPPDFWEPPLRGRLQPEAPMPPNNLLKGGARIKSGYDGKRDGFLPKFHRGNL
jgi:hypothetical protein